MSCDAERSLLRRALEAIDDTPPLAVLRKLEHKRDQGTSLVDRSLLGGLSGELKDELLAWSSNEETGHADAALGALVGLAVGDWVGAPLEFLPAVDVPGESRWDHASFQCCNPNMNEKERGEIKPGQWTDDTAMALCLADSLIVKRGLDGSDLRVRFWSWHAEGYNNTYRFDPEGAENQAGRLPRASFGLGYNIAKSLLQLSPDEDISPQFLSPGSSDSGNGGLMRLAPVPIFYACRDQVEALEAAALSSLTTHPGEMASEAARCLAFLVRRAIVLPRAQRAGSARGFLLTACDDYAELALQRIEALDSKHIDLASTLQELRALLLSTKPDEGMESCWKWRSPTLPVLETLKCRGEKYNGYPVSRPYFGSYCMDGLAMALHAVATTSCFHEAIERAANFLGDADTVAAIAGQLAGAFYGYSSIDPRYTAALRTWDHDEIACRAALCFLLGRA